MKPLIRNIVMFGALICAAFGSHSAFAAVKDAVMDARGNVVSTSSGDCVRTKWDVEADKCGTYTPPAAMTEHKRAYLVFFDFDRSDITPAAQEVLQNLVTQTQGSASREFEVIGHADRSGSDAYNMALSQRRANKVKAELLRLGAMSHNIKVEWKGEHDPLIPTEDGIKEPQNRRAEIKVRTAK